MILSNAVKESRYERVRSLLKERRIDLLISGMTDANVRYFTGPYYRSVMPDVAYVLFPKEGEPSLLIDSMPRTYLLDILDRIGEYMWIKDRKMFTPASIISDINGFGSAKGRIAVAGLNSLPLGIYQLFQKALPGAEIVDGAEIMVEARKLVTDEDIKVIEKTAEIADACYEEAKKAVKVGVYNYEVIGAWEYRAKMYNYEIALVSMIGVHPADPISGLFYPVVPRRIKGGDLVIFDISPIYYGYIIQLARQVSVGPPKKEIVDLYEVTKAAQKAGVEALRPGNKMLEVNRAMEKVVEDAGYLPASVTKTAPNGHAMGFNLDAGVITNDNETEIYSGHAFVLHPSACVKDWKPGKSSVFGPGDCYLVTDRDTRRLNRASQELEVL